MKIGRQLSSESSNNLAAFKSRILPGLSAAEVTRQTADGAVKMYKTRFAFNSDLRKYLRLQYPRSSSIAETKTKLSTDVRITSAGSEVDTLALPVQEYILETWGINGAKLLEVVQETLDDSKKQASTAILPNKTKVAVRMEREQLILDIEAIEDIIVEIAEQVSWLASVGGATQVSLLEEYVSTRNTGPKACSETYFTEPRVSSNGNGCFNVGFTLVGEKQVDTRCSVPSEGECWKAMLGFALVAKGYSITRRPHRATGLETRLPVLLDLIMGSDGPQATRTAGAAGGSVPRPLVAAGCERGNIFYWHYLQDQKSAPTKLHTGVDPVAGDDGIQNEESRHFVGWSSDAGFLAGTSHIDYDVKSSRLVPLGEYQLVVPNLTITARLPQVFSAGLSVTMERLTNNAQSNPMSRHHMLRTLKRRYFVLWDVGDKRGWLVDGATASLHLLRANLEKDPKARGFNFSSLRHINDARASSAFDVLDNEENIAKVLWWETKESREGDAPTPDVEKPPTPKSKILGTPVILGQVLDGIYAALWKMVEVRGVMDVYSGLSGAMRKTIEEKWGRTMKGWDFDDLASDDGAQIYSTKLAGAGWLDLAKALKANFLFGHGFGEVLQPLENSGCPYFHKLPAQQNYLAVGTALLDELVDKWQGPNARDTDEVRLHREICWDSPEKPFVDTCCSYGPHLEGLDPSCFPVQFIKQVPMKDNKTAKGKTLLRRGEFKEMLRKFPNGVVVFGKSQPQGEALRQMALELSQGENSTTRMNEKCSSPLSTATYSSRPASHGSSTAMSHTASSTQTAAASPTAVSTSGSLRSCASKGSSGSIMSTKLDPLGTCTGAGHQQRPQTPEKQTAKATARRVPSDLSVETMALDPAASLTQISLSNGWLLGAGHSHAKGFAQRVGGAEDGEGGGTESSTLRDVPTASDSLESLFRRF